MLFLQTAITLLASAGLASAVAHDPSVFESSHELSKRACPRVNLSTSQKREAAALSSLSKALASKSRSISLKSKSLNSKSNSVQSKASSLAAQSTALAKASSALAAKSASISAKSVSVNEKSSSVSSRQGAQYASLSSASASQASAASSLSSASSALAAATSAAGASSHCYAIGNLDVTLTSHAAGPSECAQFCGKNYDVVALVEPSSPPATCLCINAASLSDLTPVSPTLCDATFGSRSGTYATGFAV